MSSMLRMGVDRVGTVMPPLVAAMEACLGVGSSAMSSMLRTGDRGLGAGEYPLSEPVELADPLCARVP